MQTGNFNNDNNINNSNNNNNNNDNNNKTMMMMIIIIIRMMTMMIIGTTTMIIIITTTLTMIIMKMIMIKTAQTPCQSIRIDVFKTKLLGIIDIIETMSFVLHTCSLCINGDASSSTDASGCYKCNLHCN